jgi:hypothetical protein
MKYGIGIAVLANPGRMSHRRFTGGPVMNPFRILTIGVGLILFSATFVSAQATRTWVSGVGDDVNPCSRTAPCKTFAGAISKTAIHGEISVLDPGGFGALTITKSITVNGHGTLAGVLAAGTNGIVINITLPASAGPVILKDIIINGHGTGIDGIRFLNGTSLHIENVRIMGFTSQGIDVPIGGSARQLYVKDSTISDATVGGVVLTGPVTTYLDNVRLERNGGYGLRAEQGTTATVRNSVMTGNGTNGLLAISPIVASPAVIHVEGSVMSGNVLSGLRASGSGATIRVGNSVVSGNGEGFTAAGGAIESYGNNRVDGNTIDGAPTSVIPQM